MRWLSIFLRNFLSYADLELDLSQVSTAAVVGKNGSGKSTLAIDVLTFALWGKGRARTLDKFIREGADEATCRITFAAGDSEYTVTRSIYRSGRGNTVSLLRNGVDALAPKENRAQHTNEEIQQEINRIVGLDYDAIRAGPVMIQNDSDNLMALGPSKGMELLIGLFGAGIYDPFFKEAGARSAAYTRDAQAAQAEVVRLQGIVDGYDEAKRVLNDAHYDEVMAQREREQLVTQIATLREKQSVLREKAQHAETLRQTVSMLTLRIEADKKEYERVLRQLSEAHAAKDTPEPAFDPLPDVPDVAVYEQQANTARAEQTKYQVLTSKLPLLEQQLAELMRRAAIVETVPCHGEGIYATCRFLVDANKQDEIDNLSASIEGAKEEVALYPGDEMVLTTIGNADKARRREAAIVAEAARRQAAVSEWRLKVDHARQFAANGQDTIKRLEAQIDRDQQMLARASEQLKKVDVEPMDMSDIDVQMEQVRTEVTERERMIQMVYEPAVRAAQVVMDRIQAAVEELPQRERAEKEAAGQAKVYAVLAKAFHRDGIPALIVENGVPVIEERANEILARMPDNYRIRLRTQRENKKGGMSDKLNIVVEANGIERDYELLSGGESFRIDFALRLALARALTGRAGTSIETLVIDEGFGSQDDDGIEAMLESLAVVQDEFGLVLVVTHQKPVIERFQTRIEVTREEGAGSTATLVQ